MPTKLTDAELLNYVADMADGLSKMCLPKYPEIASVLAHATIAARTKEALVRGQAGSVGPPSAMTA